MRFSGYTAEEVKGRLLQGQIITREDLQFFQSPNSEKSLVDAVKSLAGNPEHPPLYHLLARFWMQLFPLENTARFFSIFVSLLLLICLYWFCIELFASAWTGWVAIALVAVSPFQVLVAQNTTQYSLWGVTILVSGITLLKALRDQKRIHWIFYSISLGISFYTHLFSAAVAIAHVLYVLCLEKFKITRTLVNYCLAGLASILLFSPWLIVIFTSLDKVKKNTQYYRYFKTNIIEISQILYLHLGHIFVDFFHRRGRLESYLHLLIFVLVIYSLYYLIRHTAIRVWLLVILLIFIPTIFQIVPDLISSSIRSLQARYYLPAFLTIQIALSFLLADKMESSKGKSWVKYLYQQIFILLLLLGIISGSFLGWTKDAGLDDQRGTASGKNIAIAEVLNSRENPLVITRATYSFVLALSYLVDEQVKFQMWSPRDTTKWKESVALEKSKGKYSDIFVLYPDEKSLEFVRSQNLGSPEKIVNGLVEIR